jgi:DNA modification methylase
MPTQPAFTFADDFPGAPVGRSPKAKRSGAFTDNMSLPVHRWFRYSAGFSGEWAETVIRAKSLTDGEYVFDPFVGSGTTLLAAQRAGAAASGIDSHSFVYRVARAKLLRHEQRPAPCRKQQG